MTHEFKTLGRKEKFSAPLVFIPYKIHRDGDELVFERDTDRNIKYNKAPFMLKAKAEQKNLQIDETQFNKILYSNTIFKFTDLLKKLEDFYMENGIDIS